MDRKDIIQQLQDLKIKFSNKSNTKRLLKKLQKSQISYGVKAFRKLENGNLQSGGVGGSTYSEFEIGKIYNLQNQDPLEFCENGFHFFNQKNACFGIDFYRNNDTVLYRIEIHGEYLEDPYKNICRRFRILEEVIPEVDKNNNSGNDNSGNSNSGNHNSGNSNSGYRNSGNQNSGDHNSGSDNSGNSNSGSKNSGSFNSGYRNSGNWNSGYRNSGGWNSGNWNSGNSNSGNHNSGNSNSGYRNSGHYNSGNSNSGYWNSGNWNSGDYNSGCFNIDRPETIRIFGKSCDRELWQNSKKPKFLNFEMRKDETYKEAFQRSWNSTTPEDKKLLELLPNFDWDIFTEISGIQKPKI